MCTNSLTMYIPLTAILVQLNMISNWIRRAKVKYPRVRFLCCCELTSYAEMLIMVTFITTAAKRLHAKISHNVCAHLINKKKKTDIQDTSEGFQSNHAYDYVRWHKYPLYFYQCYMIYNWMLEDNVCTCRFRSNRSKSPSTVLQTNTFLCINNKLILRHCVRKMVEKFSSGLAKPLICTYTDHGVYIIITYAHMLLF